MMATYRIVLAVQTGLESTRLVEKAIKDTLDPLDGTNTTVVVEEIEKTSEGKDPDEGWPLVGKI